jgi:hypothetical protein
MGCSTAGEERCYVLGRPSAGATLVVDMVDVPHPTSLTLRLNIGTSTMHRRDDKAP